jgi:trigger factor
MADDTRTAPPDEAAPTDATTETEANPADDGKLKQSVEITDIGPCKKHVKITVDRDAINERLKEKFDELLKDRTAAVPGFRPGKAPRKYIERKFKSTVTEDVRREVLMASLQQLAEDSNISPLAPPELAPEDLVLPEEGPFVYEFDVEVRPDFELPEYKDIKDEMRRLLEPEGSMVPKEGKDVKVEANDIIVGDLVTTDGAKELNKSTEIRVRVEKRLALNDGVVEEFAKKVVGAKPGETRELDVKLSEKVADQTLKGKTVTGQFTIKDIKVIRLPELTPDLLERYGVKTEGQLEELIANSLERNLEFQQRQFARQQILQQVAEKVKWDLPRDLLVRQATRTLQRRVMEMRSAGMNDQQIEARMTVLRQNVLQSTAVSLMEHFVLQKVAETEKIEIEDSDIDGEIQRIAAQSGESFRKVKAQMERDDLIEALATDLLERKALDVVLNNAVYEEFEIKPEEQEGEVATVSAQAVPGEMVEPTEGEEPSAE